MLKEAESDVCPQGVDLGGRISRFVVTLVFVVITTVTDGRAGGTIELSDPVYQDNV